MTDNIDVGQLSEAINDKMDRDANNAEDALRADYVIDYQAPTADNNYTWYRLYRSGWVEQGGRIIETSYANVTSTVVYLKEMDDTNYNMSAVSISQTSGYPTVDFRSYSTTGCTINRNNSYGITWRVEGMSAQS